MRVHNFIHSILVLFPFPSYHISWASYSRRFSIRKKPWHLNVCFFYATVLVFLSKPVPLHLENEQIVILLEQPMKFSMQNLMFKQRKEIVNLELISSNAGRLSA